jgi:FkbM family methyltransferase
MVVRIAQGKLRGYRWVAGSGPNGLWLGSYELPKQKRLMEFLQEGSVVYDIGANVGIYTLLSSECIGPTGHVHAFEPLPENFAFLERHVRMNRRQNVTIHPLAVSSNSGKARFARTDCRCTSHINGDGELEVNTISLDEFVFEAHNQAPSLIQIDVEGGELNVLRGAQRLLGVSPPVIFLATHGNEVHLPCCDLLRSCGYHIEGLDGESIDMTDELVCLPLAH